MSVAVVRPGDTLVIGFSDALPDEQYERLRRHLEGLGVTVVCIEGAQAFAVISARTEG